MSDSVVHSFGPLPQGEPLHFDLDAPTHRSSPTSVAAPGIPAIESGKVFEFGDYELIEEIARGGMGVVYRARQKSLSRIVALKMILAGQFASPDDVLRFRAEAEAAANLRHDAIVSIYEIGEIGGQQYFTMEFMEGESLASRLARGPLPAEEAAELLEAVAEAIQHAHERQVIHRDLKPGNILLDSRNRPHVTDFGLAKRGTKGNDTTHHGHVIGTPSYMPPEQAGGQLGPVTAAADVYSLGAVLYAAITGQSPFNAPTPLETLILVLEQEPAWPRALNRAIPRDLEAIVMKCLQKAPAARYRTAQQVADELHRFRSGEPIHARREDAVYRTLRWLRKNVVVAGISGTAALLLLGLTAGTHVQGQPIARQPLVAGMSFQIGSTLFRVDSLTDTVTDAPTIVLPVASVANKSPTKKTPRLVELLGRTLGEYQLDKIIAATQSGILFRAHELGKNEVVAVKVLAPDLTHGEEQKDRFVRAMKTMLPLRHPNIVRLYDAGKNGPFCWAAMEFIEGESLLQAIDRIGIDGMLDWRQVWRVAVHIGRAIQFASENKVIHRNVTPTNILRRRADRVCLLGDLMLAKALEGAQSAQITQPGKLVGEVAYLAPERTYPDGVVDTRSDLYGLGATLYALLAGRPPFGGESLSELLRHVREESPCSPRDYQYSINTVFENAVMKLLAKRPDCRYQTPADLLRDLERIGRFANLEADEIALQ